MSQASMKPVKKTPRKKKVAKRPKAKRKPNAAFMRPLAIRGDSDAAKESPWSAKEILLLVRYYGIWKTSRLAGRLGRSEQSVNEKARRLKLTANPSTEAGSELMLTAIRLSLPASTQIPIATKGGRGSSTRKPKTDRIPIGPLGMLPVRRRKLTGVLGGHGSLKGFGRKK